MSLRRWDLAWVHLDLAQGHEQAGRRPALVLSNDIISGAIGLVAVVPITSLKPGRRVYPTEVPLGAGVGALNEDSLALCHQLRTVSATRLSPPFGSLAEPPLRAAVVRAVRLWLDLQS